MLWQHNLQLWTPLERGTATRRELSTLLRMFIFVQLLIKPLRYLPGMIFIVARKGIDDPGNRGGAATVMKDSMICCQFFGGQGGDERLEFSHGGFQLCEKLLF